MACGMSTNISNKGKLLLSLESKQQNITKSKKAAASKVRVDQSTLILGALRNKSGHHSKEALVKSLTKQSH